MIQVLVTGAGGQLGQALQHVAKGYSGLSVYFADSAEGNITSTDVLEKLFEKVTPQYCINAAAYTAVDKAETEQEAARLVNVTGAANVAKACLAHQARLIHISTDFVFNGKKNTPYTEQDEPDPINVYGATKLLGERQVAAILPAHYIIRTSWVYSDYGNNFMKTMLRLASTGTALNVVNDQYGTPTNALSLAKALLDIILYESSHNSAQFGTYHYSNEGEVTWYGFAQEIFKKHNLSPEVNPVTSGYFSMPATRPAYSVMDKSKIKETFKLNIPQWQTLL